MPRVQLKKAFASGGCSLDDPNSISNFGKKFVVSEGCVKSYLEHLKLLELKKEKRKKDKAEKKAAEKVRTYEDYNWIALLDDGSLSKQAVAVLDKYLKFHHLECRGNKKAKLNRVQRHITHNLHAAEQNKADNYSGYGSDTDTDESAESGLSSNEDEEEQILAELCSDEDEESGDDRNDEGFDSRMTELCADEEEESGNDRNDKEFDSRMETVTTRSGRIATRLRLY